MTDEKNIKIRHVQCYDCCKTFERQQLKRMRDGDVLLCDLCRHDRNRKRVKASIKLKKRKIA